MQPTPVRSRLPEDDAHSAATRPPFRTETTEGGLVPPTHERSMTAPRLPEQPILPQVRPGQAGPTPGDFFGYHNGPVITNVHVIPMFWGTWWDNSTNPSVIQVYAALASIVGGTYMSGLAQYKGIGNGQVLLEWGTRSNGSNPPNNFTDSNVQSLIAAAIDAGTVPAPNDLPGNPYLYTVFMPPGISPKNGAGGEHTYFNHNGVNVHYAWVTFGGGLDSITSIFSHELAEAVTDPEGNAYTFTSEGDPGYSGWIEVGDVCQAYGGRLNGVAVQAYWSQAAQACVIPGVALAPIPRWFRMGNESISHGILNGGLDLGVDNRGVMHLFARGANGDILELNENFDPTWGNYSSLGGYIFPDAFSVAVNTDGRLELFGVGSDSAVWHNWQTSPGGGWSGWNSLGGKVSGRPVVARNANGQLEVFAIGTDSAVWTIKEISTPDWNKAWSSLGGKVLTGWFVPPVMDVIANSDGRLEAFCQGTDAALYHNWQTSPNGGWSGWNRIGGVISQLTLARGGDGLIYAFVRGSDSGLYVIRQVGSLDWGGSFTGLGGTLAGTQLTAGTNKDGRVECFWQGSNGNAMHIWQNASGAPINQWSGIGSLGGGIQKIKVASNADGRFELAVIGMDSYAWHLWQTAPSNGWNY